MTKYLNGLITDENGTKRWYKDGRLHREDGPAFEGVNSKQWCIHGKYHREDGPAIEYRDGNKRWYQNDRFHRLDGPAVIDTNSNVVVYCINGEVIDVDTYEEFLAHPTRRKWIMRAFW